LKSLRASKQVSAAQALSQLKGWEAAENGALVKNYVFEDFNHSSNFMLRYTEYC